jgi:sterol 3beta-glucosyltransferase
MVHRAGVGPPGCNISDLSIDILVEAFHTLRTPSILTRVAALSQSMNAEDGVARGVESFYRNLPLEDMLCEVSIFDKKSRIAKVYCQDCGLKMSSDVDTFIHESSHRNRSHHVRVPYR